MSPYRAWFWMESFPSGEASMDERTTARSRAPKPGLRRPDYGPLQPRTFKKFPTTPRVTRRRTVVDENLLLALNQTHIGPVGGPGTAHGSGTKVMGKGAEDSASASSSAGMTEGSDPHDANQAGGQDNLPLTMDYSNAPTTPKRESRTTTMPGSGRRTSRRRSRSANPPQRTTPLKALADANQARVNRLILEATRRGRVGRDKHSPMGILRLLSRIPGFNPPPEPSPDRPPIPGSSQWKKLTPKSPRTYHIPLGSPPPNPFASEKESISNSGRRSMGADSLAQRSHGLEDNNPFIDSQDYNHLWDESTTARNAQVRRSIELAITGGESLLDIDGDTRDYSVHHDDLTGSFMNQLEDRSLHIDDITFTSERGFGERPHAEHEQSNQGQDEGASIALTMEEQESLPESQDVAARDIRLDYSLSMGDSQHDPSEDQTTQPLEGLDADPQSAAVQETELGMNMEEGWEDILDDDADAQDKQRVTSGSHLEEEPLMDEMELDTDERDLAEVERALDDGYDGDMNVHDEDHIEQQEHDEQQDRPGVQYFDDFPSELGIMSNGEALPTHRTATKKTVRLSASGIPVPAMPTSLQKQLMHTFSRSRISQEAMAVVLEGSHLFFEQASNDLAAYAEHAGRKTIDESDVECLMQRLRITNDKVSVESLLQRYLPRELRDLVLYPSDMRQYRRR